MSISDHTDSPENQGESPADNDDRQSALDRLTPLRGNLKGIGTRYSRTVNLLKYGLPALALLVVLVVVGWPGVKKDTEGFRLTFSSFVRDQDGAPGMLNARFVGSDAEGRPFMITSRAARQDPKNDGLVHLDNLQADLTLKSGNWLSMTASAGDYNAEGRALLLSAPVDIFSDEGYEFHAGDTTVNLKTNEARSNQPVYGQGTFGNIKAQSFVISERGNRIRFQGQVKLVMRPPRRKP